jgi:hypothetical protein
MSLQITLAMISLAVFMVVLVSADSTDACRMSARCASADPQMTQIEIEELGSCGADVRAGEFTQSTPEALEGQYPSSNLRHLRMSFCERIDERVGLTKQFTNGERRVACRYARAADRHGTAVRAPSFHERT